MAITPCLNIKLKGLEKMPRHVRGYHELCGEDKYVYYRQDDTPSGIQNTILHEIREMMETLFTVVKPEYQPLKTSARHIAANRFASAVLLPEEKFRDRVYETGLDVIALSRIFSKSCSQVLLRMGEVLQSRLFFYGALYESNSSDGSEWAVTYWTGCHNEDSESNIYGLDWLFPKKGRVALPGSLVDHAVKERRPQLVKRITLSLNSQPGKYELAAIASPQVRKGAEVEKVALIVLQTRDMHLIKPQIDALKPAITGDFHRHI
ncbi:MAG: ImmA/IrrE family metallo-endopeptidase [Dehalogenimonas sp.]